MEGITIGQPARPFRLPSAQGGEVGLEDYRGRKHVIVWFTKGMGCPFCRSQMTQLSRSYADVQSLDGEVLEISVSPVRRARLYAEKFRLPFPYLCDPDYRVRQQWGIASRQHGIGHYVSTLVKGMTSTVPDNDFGTFSPPLDEMRRILDDRRLSKRRLGCGAPQQRRGLARAEEALGVRRSRPRLAHRVVDGVRAFLRCWRR
jgi:peroxiredoxin